MDNSKNRASYTDALIKKAGVNYILDLADTDANIKKLMSAKNFNSPYAKSIYDEEKLLFYLLV